MAFVKKIIRDFEKISIKLKGCKTNEGLGKIYKHLNKRLEYIITPKKLIEKEKGDVKLLESYEEYKESKEIQGSLQEHILQKCLSILEKTVTICNSKNNNNNENNNDIHNKQNNKTTNDDKKTKQNDNNNTCWWFAFNTTSTNSIFDSDSTKKILMKPITTMLKKLVEISSAQLSEKIIYFHIFFHTINIYMNNNNHHQNTNKTLGDIFQSEIICSKIQSKELLRKLASITFRTAVYLEKELVSSSIDCYYNLFFISSMLTSCAFDTSSAAATADATSDNGNNHDHIVFARYQYSFATYKKLLSLNDKTIQSSSPTPPDQNNRSIDLNILTRSILTYISNNNNNNNYNNACSFIQKIVNMIIGNQARWQRKYKVKKESFLSNMLWETFAKSMVENDNNNSMINETKCFILHRISEAYKFYILEAGDETIVQEMCLNGYCAVHSVMRNYFAKQSNPTRFILHWSISLFDNILLLKNIEKEDIVQHSRFSINELFQQFDTVFATKDYSKQFILLGWRDIIYGLYNTDNSCTIDRFQLLKKSIAKLQHVNGQYIKTIKYPWYIMQPTVALLQNVATIFNIYNETDIEIQLFRQALGWEDHARHYMAKNVFVQYVLKTIQPDFIDIKLKLVETLYNQGFTTIAINILKTIQPSSTMAKSSTLSISYKLLKEELKLHTKYNIEHLKHELETWKTNVCAISKFDPTYGKHMFTMSRLHHAIGQMGNALDFAKRADLFYHRKVNHLTLEPTTMDGDEEEENDIDNNGNIISTLPLNSWPVIQTYISFLSFMNVLYQQRCLPSCSKAYLSTGIDLTKVLRANTRYETFQLQLDILTNVRCRSFIRKDDEEEKITFKPFRITKTSKICVNTLAQGLGHIEHSVFIGNSQRAKSEIKHVNKLISSMLKLFCSGNDSDVLDKSWICSSSSSSEKSSGFQIDHCTKILNMEQEKMFHELELHLKSTNYEKTDDIVRKMMKKCFQICKLPIERAVLCYFQSKIKPKQNILALDSCKTAARFVWGLSIPFITRQVLRGYVGTKYYCLNSKKGAGSSSNNSSSIGMLALLSIGLSYDLWHYNNNNNNNSSSNQNISSNSSNKKTLFKRFNPTLSSLKNTQEHTMLRLKKLQQVNNWDVVSMYYDNHLGIVMTHVRNGEIAMKAIQITSSQMEILLNNFNKIQMNNEKTLDDACNIDTSDNNAKKNWWKSRYEIENDMKTLIEKLDELVSVFNFGNSKSSSSLESKMSNMSLSSSSSKNNPIILILGSEMQCFPWESTKTFHDIHVTRMPSIHSLLDLWERVSSSEKKTQTCYKLSNSSYVINPERNLPQTEKNFCKLKDGDTCNGALSDLLSGISNTERIIIGKKPASNDIMNLLNTSEVLTYWGHDSLMKFTSSGKVAKSSNETNCIIFDMGCNSGRLYTKGRFGSHGKVFSLISAGCPAVVSNLWKVSSGDCDILAMRLLNNIASCEKGKWLNDILKSSLKDHDGTNMKLIGKRRGIKNIKLPFLNGSATICYGVPVVLKM